jgi:hypothetical protein
VLLLNKLTSSAQNKILCVPFDVHASWLSFGLPICRKVAEGLQLNVPFPDNSESVMCQLNVAALTFIQLCCHLHAF